MQNKQKKNSINCSCQHYEKKKKKLQEMTFYRSRQNQLCDIGFLSLKFQ